MTDATRPALPLAQSATPPTVADPSTAGGNGPATPDVVPAIGGRYLLGAEIARGGMGVVYRATDTVLGREVAVKVLQSQYALDSTAARRFADEAHITAQLQHPGIPPVHDLGTLSDGRPFLAMKLIKGDTLDALLRGRTDLTVDRGRFVAVYEQICHAVGYAHAHGVIHRDLKPANVMVGSFAEVQVMDWGLAKVLANPGSHAGGEPDDPNATTPGSVVHSLRDTNDQFTQAGSILGTPAYMPPEQAAGAVGKVDARSDVFGLGAILAVVLSGKPPFAGNTAETTRVKAAQADVTDCFARLDTCGADPELVALCKRCLSAKKEDRPADAGVVAKRVAELRAAADERARQAELDLVTAGERRKRRRVLLLFAAVVGLVALTGGGLAYGWDQKQRETDRRLREIEDRAAEAEQAGDLTRAAAIYGELESCVSGDPRLAHRGPDAARRRDDLDRLARFRRESGAALRFGVHNVRSPRERTDATLAHGEQAVAVYGLDQPTFDAAGLPSKYRAEVLTTGREVLVLVAVRLALFDVKGEVGNANTRRALGLLDRAAALPTPADWATTSGLTAGELMLKMFWHRRLGEGAAAEAAGEAMTALVKKTGGFASARDYYLFGSITLNLVKKPKEALAAYRQALAREPNHYGALFGCFLCHSELKDTNGQVAALTGCLALRPNDPDLFYFRGMAWFTAQQYDDAALDFDAAVRHDPTYAKGYFYRGRMLVVNRKWADAEKDFTRAIDHDPNLTQAVSWRGIARVKTGRPAEGVADADRAAAAEPNDSGTLFSSARACAQAAGAEKDAATADGYAVKCVAYLRRALEAGFTEIGRTGEGGDFDPVRGRDDFKALMANPPKKK